MLQRGAFALIFVLALFLDLFQVGIAWGFLALGTVAGTVGGAAAFCAVGAQVAGDIGCAVLGFFGGLVGTAANAFLAPATVPIAVGIGFAISVCLSMTWGSAIIMLLVFNGAFYPKLLWGMLVEVTPGAGYLPFWTGLVWFSILESGKKAGGKRAILPAIAGIALSPQSALGKATAAVGAANRFAWPSTGPQESENSPAGASRLPLSAKSFEGVRPPQAANDTTPTYAKAA